MKEEEKEPDKNNYEDLFNNLGYERSRKLVNYLMMKIMRFNTDYSNPDRLYLVESLKDMSIPYYTVFGKNII